MQRPQAIPEAARWSEDEQAWIQEPGADPGTDTNSSGDSGTRHRWRADGTRWSSTPYREGQRHGVRLVYHGDGVGVRSQVPYAAGQLDGTAEIWRLDGTLARRAGFQDGQYREPLQDFDRDGAVLASADINVPLAPAPIASPDERELSLLSALTSASARASAAASLKHKKLSPAATAYALARGWGGDAARDDQSARAYRELVTAVAPASLQQRLHSLDLDTTPLIDSLSQLARAVYTLGADPAVDARALSRQLLSVGGVGLHMALAGGAGPLYDALSDRVADGWLDLSGLGLSVLRPEIQLFPGLHGLDLRDNQLTGLPPEIGRAFALSELRLSGNRIATLPLELTRLSELEILDLSHNQLRSLPEGLFSMTGLRALHVHDNPLPETVTTRLRAALPACRIA